MDLKTKGFVALLFVFACWLGWKYFTAPDYVAVAPPSADTTAPTPTAKPEVSTQDIAELLAVPITISNTPLATTSANFVFTAEKKPGFVTLFGENISTSSAQRTITQIKTVTDQKTWIAVDHEGGTVQRLSGAGFTRLPALRDLCRRDATLREAVLATSAAQLQKVGVNVVFAPVIDLASQSAVLKTRTCSTDPVLTGQVTEEAIRAYSTVGILPVIKHYPGIGWITADLHNELDAVYRSPAELPLIKQLLKNQPAIGVMTTFVLVSDLSEKAPCALDATCVGELESYSNQSLIFSDALEMKSALVGADLQSEKSLSQVSKEAVLAGNHVLVYGKGVTAEELQEVLNTLTAEYASNPEMKKKIDAAIIRVRTTKKQFSIPVVY
jgi:beta-N-acetylhexosaminidase